MNRGVLPAVAILALITAADFAAAGSAYLYIQDGSGTGASQIWLDDSNCSFAVNEGGGSIFVNVDCADGVLIEIASPDGAPLQTGLYLDTRETSYFDGRPFLDCQGCHSEIGWFEIHEIHRDPVSGDVDVIALDFESHCAGAVPGFQGQVRIGSDHPIDGSLEPFQLRLFGRPADPIFQGAEIWLHEGMGDLTWADATLNHVELGYLGIDGLMWQLEFAAPDGEILTLGAYPGAVVQLPPSGECPRMMIQHDGLDCSGGEAWFQIDELWYEPTLGLLRFGATFEQYCGDATDPLHGQVRYTSMAPWTRPRIESTLVVVSEDGDPVGDGSSYDFRDEDSVFDTWLIPSAYRIEYRFLVEPPSGRGFSLLFSPPDGLQLAPGVFDGVDGSVTAAAIDFNQRCSGATGELRGQLRYDSNLPTDLVFADDFDRGLFRHWSATEGQAPGCP